MGKYAAMMFIGRELREEPAFPGDEWAGARILDAAREQGYHPVSDPVLSWHEITQREVDLEVAINGGAPFAAGDWRVRGTIEVAEDAEIAEDAGIGK